MIEQPQSNSGFTHVEAWVFDLDNTLYPADCNLFAEIDRRMSTFIAAGRAAGGAGAPLGSPAFRPSPGRPIGWRGDWTGPFPGATPPREWSRRIKGATTDIRSWKSPEDTLRDGVPRKKRASASAGIP